MGLEEEEWRGGELPHIATINSIQSYFHTLRPWLVGWIAIVTLAHHVLYKKGHHELKIWSEPPLPLYQTI